MFINTATVENIAGCPLGFAGNHISADDTKVLTIMRGGGGGNLGGFKDSEGHIETSESILQLLPTWCLPSSVRFAVRRSLLHLSGGEGGGMGDTKG